MPLPGRLTRGHGTAGKHLKQCLLFFGMSLARTVFCFFKGFFNTGPDYQ